MRIVITLVLLLACVLGYGQAANQVFANDTTKGAQTKYFTATKEAGIYQGIAGFTFTTSHDNVKVYLEGSYTSGAWYILDSLTIVGSNAVNRILYQAPPKMKNHRLRTLGSAGDTCYFTNVRFFLKY